MTGQKQTDPANSYQWQIHNMAFLCCHLLFPLITLVSISMGWGYDDDDVCIMMVGDFSKRNAEVIW